MKRLPVTIIMLLFASTAFASIPYCPGTLVTSSKDRALQSVITEFAKENDCQIGGHHCILNFAKVKYSIAWAKPCPKSAARKNDPKGSTFICMDGVCKPLGFNSPSEFYEED